MNLNDIIIKIENAIDTDDVDNLMESILDSQPAGQSGQDICKVLHPLMKQNMKKKPYEKRSKIKRAIEVIELHHEMKAN